MDNMVSNASSGILSPGSSLSGSGWGSVKGSGMRGSSTRQLATLTERAAAAQVRFFLVSFFFRVLCLCLCRSVPFRAVPCRDVSCRAVPFMCRALPCAAVPHRTAPHRTVPHRILPFCSVPYRSVPHRTAPHSTAPCRSCASHLAVFLACKRVGVLVPGIRGGGVYFVALWLLSLVIRQVAG